MVASPNEQYCTEERQDHTAGRNDSAYLGQKRNGRVSTDDESEDGDGPHYVQSEAGQREEEPRVHGSNVGPSDSDCADFDTIVSTASFKRVRLETDNEVSTESRSLDSRLVRWHNYDPLYKFIAAITIR